MAIGRRDILHFGPDSNKQTNPALKRPETRGLYPWPLADENEAAPPHFCHDAAPHAAADL